MYCRNCKFIVKGPATRCPYCGSEFEKPEFLDKKIYLFHWVYLSVRQLLFIISVNLYVLFLIADIILMQMSINIHLMFYGFIAIFGLLIILCDFVLKSVNKNKMMFLKSFIFFSFISVLLSLSYRNDIFGKSIEVFLFGYYYPIVILIEFFSGMIKFLVIKKFNLFSTFFYVLFLVVFSTVLFILTFVGHNPFQQDIYACLLIYISFALSIVMAVNALVLGVLKMQSAVNIE